MVRAIDAQQSILQTHSTEKVQQIQQQHADMQQRYFQLKLSEEDRLTKERVNHSDETQKAAIREKEERERRRKSAAQQNQDHHELYTPDDSESPEEGGVINIKV